MCSSDLGEVLISIFLIAFNAGLVFGMVQALGRLFPRFDFSDQLSPSALPQLIIYIVPILLLFLEWYAWDVITSLRKNRNKV